ncbi:alanine--tRNA ligase [Candidatus Izemoplasma sp. B36]|uniref:alanine--tRNA ligase n=1 Tax=Candidatus Izemoplasma sp. B36 TaxID=3242468 RepID=UPI00355640C5
MKYMTGNQIRNTWLKFFKNKGHLVEEGASLIPNDDPTLLWMNSGVAALKKYFDGRIVPKNPRIVNVQKCIRTNDIENVGNTARHHTFFEMLGNFSIGDYFREDALDFAFEILTSDEYFGFDLNKLYFTVYPQDQESYDKWVKLGVPEDHIIDTDDQNFWEIGEGPCGPCTEVFFDRGPTYGDYGTETIKKDIENDRFVEIWNIVFSQYNAIKGLEREAYPELPNKNIDTGAGLERFVSVIQGAKTNFETDLFMPIMAKISEIADVKYTGQKSFKVIADHIRTVTMAVADGAMMSNEGRGYVLRRLLRRAVKYGKQLKISRPFLTELVDVVVLMMKDFYPYVVEKQEIIKKIVTAEENKFLETLQSGEKKFFDIVNDLNSKTINGKEAFLLYDTYGFPVELTMEYAEEIGFSVDVDGFNVEMEKQKERARNARGDIQSMSSQNQDFLMFEDKSEFVGYDKLIEKTKIIKVFPEGIVLRKTPFYATSGGQVADTGIIYNDEFTLNVIDVEKLPNGQFLHKTKETVLPDIEGLKVTASVDKEKRRLTEYNHSATHLMFYALRQKLGNHVSQQGSFVNEEGLRFDFNHYESLSDSDILEIETMVKDMINNDFKAVTHVVSVDEAKEKGAIAEFGEKYEEKVRMIDLKYTLDLCGGTHVENIKDIKDFAIKSISSIGSGIYRIEGVTNKTVKNLSDSLEGLNQDINNLIDKANKILLKAKKANIDITFDFNKEIETYGSYQDVMNKRKLLQLAQTKVKELEKSYNKIKEQKSLESVTDFSDMTYGNKIIGEVKNLSGNALKQLVDDLAAKLEDGLVLLASNLGKKVIFVCKSNNPEYNAGKLVKGAAIICSGNGGGRPDFAQAGGKDPSKIKDAIEYVKGAVL